MQLVRNNWIASQSRKQKSMKATTFPRRLPVKQRKRKIKVVGMPFDQKDLSNRMLKKTVFRPVGMQSF